MKRIVISMMIVAGALVAFPMALAAQDLSKVIAAPTYNWSGVYVGANAGYGWGRMDVTDTTGGVAPGPFSYKPDGYSGGAFVGLNRQFGAIVVGGEMEAGYADLTGSGRIASSVPTAYQTIELQGGWYAMAAARLGVAVDKTLFYAKGGYVVTGASAGQTTTNPGYATFRARDLQGWAYGAGLEVALLKGWTMRAEWLRMDFGTITGNQTSVSDPPIGYQYVNKHDLTVDTMKLGIAYKF